MIYDQIPLFSLCAAASAVTDIFGTSPTRIYPFGEAPQGVSTPYAVWQVITGLPENYLDKAPDADFINVQVDVYADTQEATREAAEAIITAIQGRCYVTHGPQLKDPETRKYRVNFDADFINSRGV